MPTYPAPGRGAWRLTGGLLPGRPGSTSSTGYYRLAVAGETPVGSAWLTGKDASHHARVVWGGVKAIQRLVGATPDGWFGPQTRAKVISAQMRLALETDGIVGPATMRQLLLPLFRDIAAVTGVPLPILGGLMVHESALDPAAVGVNGIDHGLAQINLNAHVDVSIEQALTPDFAVHWSAEDLAHVAATWRGKTTADVWDIAIANHNSPLLARRWATSGSPPVVEGREFQIQEYVEKVKGAWAT